jgi:hypothetical protein
MPTNVNCAFAKKPFPSFITSHPIFTSLKEVKKVFPEIGLTNCEKEIGLDNTAAATQAARNLLAYIVSMVNARIDGLREYAINHNLRAARQKKHDNCKHLLKWFRTQLTRHNLCIKHNSGRITLNLHADIMNTDKKVVFKAGEGIFRVYNKLNALLSDGKFRTMDKIESIYGFKEFSSQNVPSIKYKVCFSSDGTDGLWDIATMSMRGITSCQAWGSDRSRQLVGSIIDPFTGIIYLTTGAKHGEYGTKMLRRCVVRLVVNKRKKQPFIGIERMYPAHDKATYKAFETFLKERTGGQFEIRDLYTSNFNENANFIPLNTYLANIPPEHQSYRDSGILYTVDNSDAVGKLRSALAQKINSISKTFGIKAISALRRLKKSEKAELSAGQRTVIDIFVDNHDYYNRSIDLIECLCDELTDEFSGWDLTNHSTAASVLATNLAAFLKSDIEGRIANPVSEIISSLEPEVPRISKQQAAEIARIAAIGAKAYIAKEIEKLSQAKASPKKRAARGSVPIYFKYLN